MKDSHQGTGTQKFQEELSSDDSELMDDEAQKAKRDVDSDDSDKIYDDIDE